MTTLKDLPVNTAIIRTDVGYLMCSIENVDIARSPPMEVTTYGSIHRRYIDVDRETTISFTGKLLHAGCLNEDDEPTSRPMVVPDDEDTVITDD
jgi:hypothetical protein